MNRICVHCIKEILPTDKSVTFKVPGTVVYEFYHDRYRGDCWDVVYHQEATESWRQPAVETKKEG